MYMFLIFRLPVYVPVSIQNPPTNLIDLKQKIIVINLLKGKFHLQQIKNFYGGQKRV